MNHTKKTVLIAAGLISLGANISSAATSSNGALAQRDVYTDGARAADARDPYTDGAKAGKFEIYSDGAWTGDTRYPATGGSSS